MNYRVVVNITETYVVDLDPNSEEVYDYCWNHRELFEDCLTGFPGLSDDEVAATVAVSMCNNGDVDLFDTVGCEVVDVIALD